MEYDWDSLQVGQAELNDSQNFFRIRHVLHEKDLKSQDQVHQNEVLKTASSKSTTNSASVTKEKRKDKENVPSKNNDRAILAVSMIKKAVVKETQPSILKSTLIKTMLVAPPPSAVSSSSIPFKKSAKVASKTQSNIQNESSSAEKTAVKSQVASKKIFQVPNGQRQFQAYELMQKRKEEFARKLKEQEDKQFKFQFFANPAPKFRKMTIASRQPSVEKKIVKQISLPHIPHKKPSKEIIVPSCGDPERLKYLNERKKMLIAKYQEPTIQFKAKAADVLQKQPFQPVHNVAPRIVDAKPFKLQLTERLMQRTEYDKKQMETNAIRKMQEEARKRQKDLVDRKFLRQKTEFKARVNPFRSH